MKRKRSLKAIRRQLDQAFSRFIRQRDAVREGDYASCFTCGQVKHWTAGHAGHFVQRQYLATRFDERNCHFQCIFCNLYRHGALAEYTIAMQQKYGPEVVDELLQAKHRTVKLTRSDYEALLAKYS